MTEVFISHMQRHGLLQRPAMLQKNSLTFLQNAGRVSTGLSPSDALNGAHSQ